MVTAKQKPKSRSSRSNSLQRMLELEKQSMVRNTAWSLILPFLLHLEFVLTACSVPLMQLERRTGSHADPDTHNCPNLSTANTKPASTASSSDRGNQIPSSRKPLQNRARPAIPRPQIPPDSSLAPRDPNRQTFKQPTGEDQRQGKMQYPYELPPINTGATGKSLATELFGVSPASPCSGRSRGHHHQEAKEDSGAQGIKPATKNPTKSAVDDRKVVAQTVSTLPNSSLIEDRSSMCQSPSWEAYGRRKKEKKQKEQADKQTKSKKRRLSKAPPSNVTPQQISMSTLAAHNPSPVSGGKAGSHLLQSPKGLAHFQKNACMSDTALNRPRQRKDRPASVLGPSSPDLSLSGDIPSPHTPRGRSSSFTSLFKAPFEARRSSFDHGSGDGFIGGIKLEQHRLAAHQKALNDYAISLDSEIHPAFRKTEKRSPSPLRLFVPRSEPKDVQNRAYPPIAIRTSAKNQALLAAETSAMPEGGVVNRWRARVGLKASGQRAFTRGGMGEGDAREKTGQKLTKAPSAQREESSNKTTGERKVPTPIISAPIAVQKMNAPTDDEKLRLQAAAEVDNSTHPALVDKKQDDEKPAQGIGNDREHTQETLNSTSETNSSPSYSMAPSSPPPPPPRSSKRKSLIVIDDASVVPNPPSHLPLVFEPQQNGDERQTVTASLERSPVMVPRGQPKASGIPSSTPRPKRWSMSNPPSIPYDSLASSFGNGASSHPRRTLKDAAKAAFGRRDMPLTSSPATNNNVSPAIGPFSKVDKSLRMQEWKISHPLPTAPPTHSSEDSFSDDLRSVSGHGTPDTSRPQSARGTFPAFGDHESDGKNVRHHSGYTSVLPSPAFSHVDDIHRANQPSPFELDPIQAAALKVMAAFPDVPVRRPDTDRRSNSDSDLITDKAATLRSQYQDRSKPRPMTTAIDPAPLITEPNSPALRDLIMSKDESSVAAPWPATYLEAARKSGPLSALVPKGLNTQSSPSTNTNPKELSPTIQPSQFSNSDSREKAASRQHRSGVGNTDDEGIAKMFLECCGCRYYHDMPSKLYEAMANPEGVVTLGEHMEFAGSVSMTVKCPWCKHEMSTKCCAGLAAMVYVKERLH